MGFGVMIQGLGGDPRVRGRFPYHKKDITAKNETNIQANHGKILINDGEILVNHLTIIDENFIIITSI